MKNQHEESGESVDLEPEMDTEEILTDMNLEIVAEVTNSPHNTINSLAEYECYKAPVQPNMNATRHKPS